MKNKIFLLLFYGLSLSIFSCNKNKDVSLKTTTVNDTSNTDFNHLYHNLLSSYNYENIIIMDLEVHAYSFEVTTPKTLIKIGYQSLPFFNSTPYLMEIFDSTSNTLLYSGSYLFSPTNTTYVSITPIPLVVGHLYSISRIQKNWAGNIGNTVGRLVRNPNGNISFPQVFGDLKIMGSTFYGTGGPSINRALPYIDIVFE